MNWQVTLWALLLTLLIGTAKVLQLLLTVFEYLIGQVRRFEFDSGPDPDPKLDENFGWTTSSSSSVRMLKMKKNYRRRISRDDAISDLSIVRGLPSAVPILSFRNKAKKIRNVHEQNEKLLEQFRYARKHAIPSSRVSTVVSSSSSSISDRNNGAGTSNMSQHQQPVGIQQVPGTSTSTTTTTWPPKFNTSWTTASSISSENPYPNNANGSWNSFNASTAWTPQRLIKHLLPTSAPSNSNPSWAPNVSTPSSCLQTQPNKRSTHHHKCVHQGSWVSRDTVISAPIQTKKYSIAQIIDIMTGHAVPPTSEIAGLIFNPIETPSVQETSSVQETEISTTTTTTTTRNATVRGGTSIASIEPNNLCVEEPIPTPLNLSVKKGKGIKRKNQNPPLKEINWSNSNSNVEEEEKSSYFTGNEQPPLPAASSGNENTGPPPTPPPVSRKQKSVSFLMDSQNNVAVQTVEFDMFTRNFMAKRNRNFLEQNKENQNNQMETEAPTTSTENQGQDQSEFEVEKFELSGPEQPSSEPTTEEILTSSSPIADSVKTCISNSTSSDISNDVVLDTDAMFTFSG